MPVELVIRLSQFFVRRRDLHSCRVYRTTAQVIPDMVETATIFDAQRFDTAPNDDIWAVGSPDRLICRRAGKYQISGTIAWEDNNVGFRAIKIRLNGVTFIARNINSGVDGKYQAISTLYELAVGDFVEMMASQSSGGNLDLLSVGNSSPEFMMARVG